LHCGTLPAEFEGLSTLDISRALGIGRQAALSPCGYRYRGLEVQAWFNGEQVYHQADPLFETFPILDHLAPDGQPGTTEVALKTSRGSLTMRYAMNAAMVEAGVTSALIQKHPVSTIEDCRVYEHIMQQAEFLPQYEQFTSAEREIGADGWLIPMLDRMPFQRLLLDIFGEVPLFYALHDDLPAVERLLALLDARLCEQLGHLSGLDVPYVEFNDNVEGSMTNPRLFRKYCLPAYQRYADILHPQGKKMGAHTDGNLKPLVALIAECGLDVCESFTPHPLTPLTIEEAWQAWSARPNGPLIWGGIPSYYLEERCSQAEFEAYIERLLALVGDGRIILGVVDAVMADNDIQRLRCIARRVNGDLRAASYCL
jgi:hypothetical protein